MMKICRKKKICAALAAMMMISVTGCSLPFSKDKQPDIEVQTSGELTMDSVIMRVGELGVTYREVLIYMYQMKERYEPGFGENIWDFAVEGDQSFGEYAKAEVMDNLIQIKIIVQQAAKQGVTLAADEVSEISREAEEYLEGIKSSDIKEYGLTQEFIEAIYQDNRLAEKMFDITTSVVDTDISDAEAKQSRVQYLAVLTKGTDRNGKDIHLKSEKDLKEALKRTQNLRKQAREAADFGNFADANSDLEEYEITYGNSDLNTEDKEVWQGSSAQLAEIPKAVLLQGLKMKTGEMSKVLETKKGYFILYCASEFDEDATRARKEKIIENEQEKVFLEAYEEWSGDYKVEIGKRLWEGISFQELS